MKAEFPAGASANRAAIPAPNRSVLPKTMVQSEGGKGSFLLDNFLDFLYLSDHLMICCNGIRRLGEARSKISEDRGIFKPYLRRMISQKLTQPMVL
jgi:hypothetical protein